MAYDRAEKTDLIVRDYLALERTHLANERTLLAYARTTIMMLISAVTLLKLFADDRAVVAFAIALIPLSGALGLFGLFRFRRLKQRIDLTAQEKRPHHEP
ncbi:MAG: DUF202 domain-containing protein [Polyangiaceae bacterium]|nr:DUF202 domain-containing protein [Polyangiaceae bacterium]